MAYQRLIGKSFALNGLNTDIQPWDLGFGYMTAARNVRIKAGQVQNYFGSSPWEPLPVGFDPGYLMNANVYNGGYWLIAGIDDADIATVYAFDGANFSNLTNLANYVISDAKLWSGCMLASVPVLNHPQSFPQYWQPQTIGTPLKDLPWDASNSWADAQQRCEIMRSHKEYLFALVLYDDSIGEAYPDGVRWSSPADISGVPDTWDPLDVTQFAGFTKLGGSGGNIIDGLSLRDAFVVYRETAIHVFDFKGGTFVFQIRTQSSTFGVLTSDCIVEVNGNHYFMGRDDFYVNNGNTVEPLLHNRLHSLYLKEANPEYFYNSFVVKNDQEDEVWFCFPSRKSEFADLAFVHGWRDNTWTVIDLPKTSVKHMAYGTYTVVGDAWVDATYQWQQADKSWNQSSNDPVQSVMAAVQSSAQSGITDPSSGAIVIISDDTNTSNHPALSGFERISFPIESGIGVTTVTRIYPRMRGTGDVYITVGSQDFPGSTIRWKNRVKFNPNTDRKIDVKTTGELHCVRIESVDPTSNTRWQISGLDAEYTPAGAR